MELPVIRNLLVTAPGGKSLEQSLPLGGFGISRYKLDSMMAFIARENGVEIMERTKVNDITYQGNLFTIHSSGDGSILNMEAKVVAGTFGKRSNLDIKWKRKFALQRPNKLNNYIGVKYHITTDWPADLIALHNFKDGYCGISQIEDKKYCLCYLTTAKNLERCGNSIQQLERDILYKNPHLEKIFTSSENEYGSPLTISQISFDKKSQVEDHVLLIGDAAGMITPLCGNGMSMALHGSKLAFRQIDLFLRNEIPRWQMEQDYTKNWQHQFSGRLRTGRIVQSFFGSAFLSNLLISALKPFPGLVSKLISQTHGQPF
jgi:flavin-dependent dehydrogenase